MKRFTGVRILTQSMTDKDIGVYIGNGLSKEAFPYIQNKYSLFFSGAEDYLLSMALGMAMCTDKRVFVFCNDYYFIRNFVEFMQIGVSRCRNIFIVMFTHGKYPYVTNAPNIFDSVSSQHGTLFNMGFLVHDYKNYFKKSKNPIKEIRQIWDRARGPLAVLMKTERGIKEMPDIPFSDKEAIRKTREFIMDKSVTAHNYVPPITLDDFIG